MAFLKLKALVTGGAGGIGANATYVVGEPVTEPTISDLSAAAAGMLTRRAC
jgi:hypothetical protein